MNQKIFTCNVSELINGIIYFAFYLTSYKLGIDTNVINGFFLAAILMKVSKESP
jgi:hypothetical protein